MFNVYSANDTIIVNESVIEDSKDVLEFLDTSINLAKPPFIGLDDKLIKKKNIFNTMLEHYVFTKYDVDTAMDHLNRIHHGLISGSLKKSDIIVDAQEISEIVWTSH